MPFSHAPVGGQGNIVVTQIQSPNFNEGTQTGWRISKDGSAYFSDIVLPNTPLGATITFSSSQPASPNPGDIWYDTVNGNLEYQYSGTTSTWVPYQMGTGAIAADSIYAAQIASDASILGSQLADDAAIAGTQLAADANILAAQLSAGSVTTRVNDDGLFIYGLEPG